MVVLDTSALIYWTMDPDRLTPEAQTAIDQTDQLVISSISIWEIGLKIKHNRLQIPLTIDTYARRLQMTEKVVIQAVDVLTWIENLALDWDHRDPADRTIVATARLLGCGLVSSDKRIADFFSETIW